MENIKIQLESLQTLIETSSVSQAEKEQSLKEIQQKKKEKESASDVQKWISDTKKYFESFKKVSITAIVSSQIIFYIIMFLFTFTPISFVSYIYDACFPAIMAAQGQMWDEGLGQFVRLQDRDIVDMLTRSILLGFALLGSIELSKSLEKPYKWFLISVVVICILVDAYASRIIYDILFYIQEWTEGNMTKREARISRMKNGWWWFHLPVMAILIGVVLGICFMYFIDAQYMMQKGDNDIMMKEVMRLAKQGVPVMTTTQI